MFSFKNFIFNLYLVDFRMTIKYNEIGMTILVYCTRRERRKKNLKTTMAIISLNNT